MADRTASRVVVLPLDLAPFGLRWGNCNSSAFLCSVSRQSTILGARKCR